MSAFRAKCSSLLHCHALSSKAEACQAVHELSSRSNHQPAGSSCAPALMPVPCCDPWPRQKWSACCCIFQRPAPCSGASWTPECLPPSWQLGPAGGAAELLTSQADADGMEAKGLGVTRKLHKDLYMQHGTHAEARAQVPVAAAASGAHEQPWGCKWNRCPQVEALHGPGTTAAWLMPRSISGTELAARCFSVMTLPSTHHYDSVWAVNE